MKTAIDRDESIAIMEPLQIRDSSSHRPALIELVVDTNQEFCPKLKSRMGDDGKFVTPELDDMFPFLDRAELISIHNSARNIYN